MNIVRFSFMLLFFLTISFAKGIENGPFYIKDKHYSIGKDELADGSTLGEDYEIRFWVKSDINQNVNSADLYKIAKKTSNDIKESSQTHLANKWFWQNVQDGQYLMIGYSDVTNSQFSYAVLKKRNNDWIYSCNRDKNWHKVKSGDTVSCKLKKGYDSIKFQFHNPDNRHGWGSSDVIYRFLILNR